MQLDQSDIVSFTKAFWLRRTRVTLSDEQAREAVENITGFFSLLRQWDEKDQRSRINSDGDPAGNEH